MSNIRGVIGLDSAGLESFNGVFGESIAESRHSDILVQFNYGYFDEQFDVNIPTVTGDGAVTAVTGELVVSSATVGSAYLETKASIRYRPGHTGYAYFTGRFIGSGTALVGPGNRDTGFMLKSTNNVMSFGYIKDGVERGSNGVIGFDTESTWNGSIVPANIDFTKFNIFMVMFGYLGVANPTLWIKLDTWQVVHCIKTEGVLTGTHVNTPIFPISLYAENGMLVSCGSMSGGTTGALTGVGSRRFAFPNSQLSGGNTDLSGACSLASTNVNTLVIFKSKDLFKTKSNMVKVGLLSYTFSVDIPVGISTGTVAFQIVSRPILSGIPSYVDINTNSSIIEYDHTPGTGASVNATLGIPVVTEYINYVGDSSGGNIIASIEIPIYGGDIFAIVAKDIDGNNVTARVTLNWEELF